MTASATDTGGLSLRDLTKRYGERTVLDTATLALRRGTVHALVGENGAGKSTLIKSVCGLVKPDAGAIDVDGASLVLGDPRRAAAAGIGVVHQHFMLVETLTVSENVVLGHEPRRGPLGLWLDRRSARDRTHKLAERYGFDVDPDARVESLSVGERQRVELLKALDLGAKYVLLDEPTAVLSPREIRALLATLRRLADGGVGVLFVSHKLDEVLAVADDVTVLRRGRVVFAQPRATCTADSVAREVVGGEPPGPAPARTTTVQDRDGIVLDRLAASGLHEVSLRVRCGEVLGVAGVEGNGQRSLAAAIAGLERVTRGRVHLKGRDATHDNVVRRRREGLGYVPEDRERTGLLPDLSIAENLALGDPEVGGATRVLSLRAMRVRAREVIEKYQVRPPDPDAPVRSLSGGNAQKVLLARELSRDLSALVVAQPTRGVDIAAAAEIHSALRSARDRGVALLLITSDLDELRALADRVIVLRSGRIAGEMPVGEATDERLGPLMVGSA